jgi:hypothetical protein
MLFSRNSCDCWLWDKYDLEQTKWWTNLSPASMGCSFSRLGQSSFQGERSGGMPLESVIHFQQPSLIHSWNDGHRNAPNPSLPLAPATQLLFQDISSSYLGGSERSWHSRLRWDLLVGCFHFDRCQYLIATSLNRLLPLGPRS